LLATVFCAPSIPETERLAVDNLCNALFQCVAAFAVSAVASQWERTGKPFNPLLGETYELVRWGLLLHSRWLCWMEFSVKKNGYKRLFVSGVPNYFDVHVYETWETIKNTN
jgi:hypothetical protein